MANPNLKILKSKVWLSRIYRGGRISFFCCADLVRGFQFRSSNLIFVELISECSTFELLFMENHETQFLRGPAGGVNFEKSRFSVFKAPAGGVDLTTSRFLYFPTSTDGKTMLICLDLGIKSMLGRLVWKNLTQRSSQRVKRPSGTWGMTCSRSLDRSIARFVGRSIARMIARSRARSLDRSLPRSLARSLDRWLITSEVRISNYRHARESLRGFEFRITCTRHNVGPKTYRMRHPVFVLQYEHKVFAHQNMASDINLKCPDSKMKMSQSKISLADCRISKKLFGLQSQAGHPLRTGQLPGKLYPGNRAIFRNRSFFFQTLTRF